MIVMFGFWLIGFAIILLPVFLFRDELSAKEKICIVVIVVMLQLFVGALEIGIALMGI